MNYTSELTLDIAAVDPACEIPVVRVKHGDAYSRFIAVTLKSDGNPYTPESGVVFRLRCRRPDGTCIFEDSSMEDEILERYLVINNGDGTITIELAPDIMDKVGVCWCDLCMYKDEQILSSMRFVIHVFPSPNVDISDYRPPIYPVEINLQNKRNISPTEEIQVITADEGYDGLNFVQINAIPSTYIGSNIVRKDSTNISVSGATVTVPSGYYPATASKSIASGSVSVPNTSITASPTISVNSSTGVITASVSTSRNVAPVVSSGYVSSGTSGTVSVGGSNTIQLSTQAAKTITPSTSQQMAVVPGKYTIGEVVVAPMPEGSAGKPTATKSPVSNHSMSITPSVINTTGYITGGTKTGTAVTVSASELVSGTKSITTNGNGIDVTNYASVNVSVPTGTHRTSADVSISDNTATVPAGLYESPISVNASQLVSGTKEITSNGVGIDVTNYASVNVDIETQPNLQDKSNVVPTESPQTITPDRQYDGLSSVQINGISTTYIGSGIDRNNSSDIVMTTNTITVPSGYYANDVTIELPEVSPGGAAITTISDPAGGTVLMIDTDGEITSSPLSVTQNGTYTAEAGTAYSQVFVNVPSGLIYEEGTYIPSSDTARPTITYSNSHSGWPLYIAMADASEDVPTSSGYNSFWSITYFENPLTHIVPNSSDTRYGIISYQYYSGSSPNFTTTQGVYNITSSVDSSANSSTSNARYWLTSTGFIPGSGSSSRYWKAGRQYKWIAVWQPQVTM